MSLTSIACRWVTLVSEARTSELILHLETGIVSSAIAMPTQIAEDFMVSSPSKLSDIFFVNGPDRPLEVEPAPSFAAMQDKSTAMQTDSQTNGQIYKDSTVGVL
jgi:hypothetical protein